MSRIRSLPEVTEQGTRALVRALGYPDAVRFLTTLRPGKGDYTKERRTLLKNNTPEQVLAESRRIQSNQRKARKRRTA